MVLRFSEPVQILNRSDVSVVDRRGRRIDNGARAHAVPAIRARSSSRCAAPLLPDSYTVRYRVVSADSHAASAAFVFAVGGAQLGAPILAGSGGLSDASPASVAARVARARRARAAARPARLPRPRLGPGGRDGAAACAAPSATRALRRGQRGCSGARSGRSRSSPGVAETVVLAAKSAVVFHTGLVAAAACTRRTPTASSPRRASAISLGWRCGALFVLVAVAFVSGTPRRAGPPSAGRRAPHGRSWRCSASRRSRCSPTRATPRRRRSRRCRSPPTPCTSPARAIWIGGLPCLVAVLLRAPRALPEGGRTLASATLARFSKVALWSVVVICGHRPRAAGRRAVLARRSCGDRLRPRPDAQGLAAAPDPGARAAQPPLRRRARRRPDARAPRGCAPSPAACRWSSRSRWASSSSRRSSSRRSPGRRERDARARPARRPVFTLPRLPGEDRPSTTAPRHRGKP